MIIRRRHCSISKGLKWYFEWTWFDYTDFKSLFDVSIDDFESVKNKAIEYACEQLVSAKVYYTMKGIKHAISKCKVEICFTVSFIDTEKASNVDHLLYEELETRSRKQFFDEFCNRVDFDWQNTNAVVWRTEIYGLIYGLGNNAVRYEMNDYSGYELIYKFGDIVKFKAPISGCNTGIIILPCEAENKMFHDMYEIQLLNNRGKPKGCLLYGYDSGIHQNDIDHCIRTDIELARKIIKEYDWLYTKEYIDSVMKD